MAPPETLPHTAINIYSGSTNTKISRNKIYNLHKGIYLYSDALAAAAPMIDNNLIYSVEYGIYLEGPV